MLLARSEIKLWFIHQKPRARRSSQLLSRYPTMRAGHLRIFVGPICTFDPQQSEDKVQMTPAQRRIRFRCLRRSRRGLKNKIVRRSQQNQNPRTKPTQWAGRKLCASTIRNNTDSRATLRKKNELPNKLGTLPSRSHLLKCAINDSLSEPTLTLGHESSFKPRRIFHHPKENEYFTSTFC